MSNTESCEPGISAPKLDISDVVFEHVLQGAGKYGTERETRKFQNLVVLRISLQIPSPHDAEHEESDGVENHDSDDADLIDVNDRRIGGNGSDGIASLARLEVRLVIGNPPVSEGASFDGNGHPFQTSNHYAQLFQLDRTEQDEDDEFEVFLGCEGVAGEVEGGMVGNRCLNARLEKELDRDMIDKAQNINGEVNVAEDQVIPLTLVAAVFFETVVNPGALDLSCNITINSGSSDSPDDSVSQRHVLTSNEENNGNFEGPFSWAAMNSWLDVLKYYAINERSLLGRTPMAWAASNGNLEALKWSFSFMKGIEAQVADLQDNSGLTLAHLAIKYKRRLVVQYLMRMGYVDFEKPDTSGRTLLGLAIETSNYEAVGSIFRALLDLWRLQRQGREGQSLKYRPLRDHSEVIRSLLIEDAGGRPFLVRIFSENTLETLLPQHRIRGWIMREFSSLNTALIKDCFWQALSWGVTRLVRDFVAFSESKGGGINANTEWSIDELKRAKTGDSRSALCRAAEKGPAEVVTVLLMFGANPNYTTTRNKDTPLMLAIKGDHEGDVKELIVDELLSRGDVDTSKQNNDNFTALDLAIRDPRDLPGVCRLLARHHEDGPLAGNAEELQPDGVDKDFKAATTNFFSEGGIMRSHTFKDSVGTLLKGPDLIEASKEPAVMFRWYHLPANNMKWAEVLVSKLYGTTTAYKILKSERWVRRQHQSKYFSHKDKTSVDIHHARFMRPFCQSFNASSQGLKNGGEETTRRIKDSGVTQGHQSDDDLEPDTPPANPLPLAVEVSHPSETFKLTNNTDYVVFMPYLHWDLQCQQVKRTELGSEDGPGPSGDPGNPYRKLLAAYLFDNDRSDTKNVKHRLHVRRTLDQYYYYTLKDTEERDTDQVVSRAACQKDLDPKHKVLIMVDQLWMWVLKAQGDNPDTVITCFPERQPPPPGVEDPDGKPGRTDVFGHIKLHMLDNPSAVQTHHDLAKLIISKCSAAFFDLRGTSEQLRFPEIYEMAIGDVVRQETDLFDDFTAVMQAPHAGGSLRNQIVSLLKEEARLEHESSKRDSTSTDPGIDERQERLRREALVLCQEYYNSAVRLPAGMADLKPLCDGDGRSEELINVMDALRWIGQIQVLDITAETKLLREIKDIAEELRIISMVFQDQKAVVDVMETICGPNMVTSAEEGDAAKYDKAYASEEEQPTLLKKAYDTQVNQAGAVSAKKPRTTNPQVRKRAQVFMTRNRSRSPSVNNSVTASTKKTRTINRTTKKRTQSSRMRSRSRGPTANQKKTRPGEERGEVEPMEKADTQLVGDDDVIQDNGDASTVRVSGNVNNIFVNSSQTYPMTAATRSAPMATLSDSSSISTSATVQLSIEAIDRMAFRARNAYKALTLLVDLKQKQSNVLDARSM